MKVITEDILAREAAESWRRQYPPGHRSGADKDDVLRQLQALQFPTPSVVNAIIGNEFWTRPPNCDECGEPAPAVVRVGEEPDYESNTAHLCGECLRAALAELRGMEKK